ncbi:beta-amylase 1, chloroplastic-like [Hibiscus syriacus]|uniref:beta-amylase 1, chloroplastic-like n=1 Tax=Hibiscus syriacus TaxID=106335 RepID=UPI001923B176|nr:beta-amylase 1, chloroplastic-like [Hibiscus syriacus]
MPGGQRSVGSSPQQWYFSSVSLPVLYGAACYFPSWIYECIVFKMFSNFVGCLVKDPFDKSKVICDEKLKELFHVETFHGFIVTKLLICSFSQDMTSQYEPYAPIFVAMLLEHGERILSFATSIFDGKGVKISVKIARIHWHYGTRSHAPELTTGYYNTRYRDGYLSIAQMLARHGAVINFTCIEMRDHEQPQDALCAPEKLVKQVAFATASAQVPLAGENALPRYNEYAHEQILQASSLDVDGYPFDREMCAFTYLRMNPSLFHPENWRRFVGFVKKMNEGKVSEN